MRVALAAEMPGAMKFSGRYRRRMRRIEGVKSPKICVLPCSFSMNLVIFCAFVTWFKEQTQKQPYLSHMFKVDRLSTIFAFIAISTA